MRRIHILDTREKRNAFFLLLPVGALILSLSLYPVLRGIYLGFTDYKIGKPIHFNGLENYVYLSTSGYFWPSLINQIKITFGAMLLTYLVAVPLALVLNSDIPFRSFFRTLVILPWAIPPVVKIVIWKNIYSTTNGWLNYLLKQMGFIDRYIGWTGDKNLAIYTIIVMIAWGCIPYLTLSLLATLQGIPKDNYEAARIDGARAMDEFWYVTVPYLQRILVVTSSFLFIWIFNDFTSQFLLTEGGPGSATLTMNVEGYRQGFQQGNFGLALSYGNLSMVFMCVCLVIYLKALYKQKEEVL